MFAEECRKKAAMKKEEEIRGGSGSVPCRNRLLFASGTSVFTAPRYNEQNRSEKDKGRRGAGGVPNVSAKNVSG